MVEGKVKRKRHPMQPIELDRDGVVRFKKNAIVEYLVSSYPGSLNALVPMPWRAPDYEQLMQLIGYSVSGYCDLSRVTDRSKDLAHERALEVTPIPTHSSSGCPGCEGPAPASAVERHRAKQEEIEAVFERLYALMGEQRAIGVEIAREREQGVTRGEG